MPNGQFLQTGHATKSFDQCSQIQLLDGATALNVGWWVPFRPLTKGSFQVKGVTTAVVGLYASNNQVMPANGFVVTVGGSATINNIVSISIEDPNLLNGVAKGSYTVQGGDSTAVIAAALATALAATLVTQRKAASSSMGDRNTAGFYQVSVSGSAVTVKSSEPGAVFTVLNAVTVGGTETLTTTQYDSAEGFLVGAIQFTNANGILPFEQCSTWVKAAVTTFTSGTISAIVQASI